MIVSLTRTHTHTHVPQSRPTQGVCTVPGQGAISSNGRKLVSVICCHGCLRRCRQTLDQSRRDTDSQTMSLAWGGGMLKPPGISPEKRKLSLICLCVFFFKIYKCIRDSDFMAASVCPHISWLQPQCPHCSISASRFLYAWRHKNVCVLGVGEMTNKAQ